MAIAERARFLLYTAPLDAKPWLRALLDALDENDLAGAAALVRASRPASIAEVAHAALGARADGEPADAAIEEAVSLAEERATERLRALRVFASIGSASGLLGAAIALARLFSGSYGLAALQAGRAEAIAISHAILAVFLGVAISVVCLSALAVFRKASAALVRDIHETAAQLRTKMP